MNGEASIEANDAEEIRRELRLSEIGKAEGRDKEKRLRGLFVKWRDPLDNPLKKSEENELLDYRIILPMAVPQAATNPTLADVEVCDSQQELARRMMLHFQNPDKTSKLRIEITNKKVSDWCKGKGLASTTPPFPTIKGGRTRYSLKEAIQWFNDYLWHEYRADANQVNGAAASPFVPIGELREVAERAELEKTLFDIEVAKGGYLATAKSEAICGGTMQQYHDYLKGLMENIAPEKLEVFCQSVGLTPDQIAVLKEYQAKENRGIIDEMELEAERRARENTNRIKAQVKHDLGQ